MQPNTQNSHTPSTWLPQHSQQTRSDVVSDMTFDELREVGHGVGLGLDLDAVLNNDWNH